MSEVEEVDVAESIHKKLVTMNDVFISNWKGMSISDIRKIKGALYDFGTNVDLGLDAADEVDAAVNKMSKLM